MDKKENVIKIARELFIKYGYKKVSMDEIAKESNVTKKTIYKYFKDKETLFMYYIDEELNTMKEKIEKLKIQKKSFAEFVSSSIYTMLYYRKNSLILSNLSKDTEQSKYFLKFYDEEILNYIEDRINEAIKTKDIKKCNVKLTSFIIYKAAVAVMFEYDEELNEKELTTQLTSILKTGLLN